MNDNEINVVALNKILEMYNELEMQILNKLAQNFLMNDEFINSDLWRIQKLEEMGVFNEQVIKYIASYTKSTPDLVKKGLQQLGVDTFNINKLKGAFEDGMISIDPNVLLNNGVIQTLINTQYVSLSNALIDMSTRIQRVSRQAYLNIVEQTYLKTTMGTHSYQEAIRESIDQLGDKGLKTLTYTYTDELTGEVQGIRTYEVEGAVRREILTNTRKLSGAINDQIIKDLKPKYVKASEHVACRPSHFDWQGTIMLASEYKKITHENEVDGLYGINCKHYVEPYFGKNRGNEEKQYSQEECDEAYKLSQKQRYLERKIRTWRRKEELFKINNDFEKYAFSKNKVSVWQNKMDKYILSNDLDRDYTREYVKFNENRVMSTRYSNLVKKSNKYYNIGTKEGNVFRGIKAERIQNKIKNEFDLQIIPEKQEKHNIINNDTSYFYINNKEKQELINNYAGKGIIVFDRKGNWNEKEIITTNKIIGKYINKNYNEVIDTNSFVIHYSKDGVHIVPANRR